MPYSRLVEAMSKPGFYPHMPDSVEVIQTHISYIFIAGDYVYKVKKAVDFGFLDFTTLEKREYYCNEELRLNRRLAPETYLDVVEIGEDDNGNLILENGGKIIEYAVKMKKLPRERMLGTLISEGKVDTSVMDAVARKLVDFHGRAATGGEIDLVGGVDMIRKNHDEDFEQTERYINITIPESSYRFIKSYIYRFMERHDSLLKKRVADHRIRDCHGDLHLDHICVTDDDVLIFDCIEFNERFRYSDVAAEVAFLAMDLDYNGYPDYADAFIGSYIKYSGDQDMSALLNFYKCYYAYVRGKVVSFMIDDNEIGEEEHKEAVRNASMYFDLAYTCAARLERPALILIAGLMGCGKSVLAENIAPRLGAGIIRSDIVRKEMQGISSTERHYEDFGKGIYSDDVSRKTYERALDLAEEKLREGKSVIIDASYKRRDERVKAYDAAARLNADFFVIECVCAEEIIRKRLDSRMVDAGEISDGRWEIFQAQKEDFDKITEVPERFHITIDTSSTPEESAHTAIELISNIKMQNLKVK
ncbi:MAG: AAA family ATPase [Proteobacteria bacterium]|nr:AAA family ATPase [Pseudomonadota bacterium]